MHRRTNKRQLYDPNEMVNNVVTMYSSMYSDITKESADTAVVDPVVAQLPTILNFDLDAEKSTASTSQNKKQEKYGIKKLINNKSKMTYPFDKNEEPEIHANTSRTDKKARSNNQATTKPVAIYDEKLMEQYINQEALSITETFIESDSTIDHTQDKKENLVHIDIISPNMTAVTTNTVDQILGPVLSLKEEFNALALQVSASIPQGSSANQITPEILKPIVVPTFSEINATARVALLENFSDIESRMNNTEDSKKIDIKNDDNSIVNINNMSEIKTNMSEAVSELTNSGRAVNENVVTDVVTKSTQVETADKTSSDSKNADGKVVTEKFQWPDLTIENINTTFKVVGDLKEGAKLKIVYNQYLAEDTAYIPSLSRWNNDQSREKLMSFFNHLFKDTKRVVMALVQDIRNAVDVDNNVSTLENLVSYMIIFLHRYEVMRNVYRSDSGTFARLGVIRNDFFIFRASLFRDLSIPKYMR